jgi:hypothetical protein
MPKIVGWPGKEKVPKSLDFRTLLCFASMSGGMDGKRTFSYYLLSFSKLQTLFAIGGTV